MATFRATGMRTGMGQDESVEKLITNVYQREWIKGNRYRQSPAVAAKDPAPWLEVLTTNSHVNTLARA